jgi:hypothetical protein
MFAVATSVFLVAVLFLLRELSPEDLSTAGWSIDALIILPSLVPLLNPGFNMWEKCVLGVLIASACWFFFKIGSATGLECFVALGINKAILYEPSCTPYYVLVGAASSLWLVWCGAFFVVVKRQPTIWLRLKTAGCFVAGMLIFMAILIVGCKMLSFIA